MADNSKGLSGLFAQFTKGFWVVNTLELFERGAYYALMAVLAQHMVQNIHFTETVTGIVMAIFMFCLYFLPFILGAIAEKVGFKQMLIANFVLMFIGYLMFGFVTDSVLFVLAIIILGVGAGGFKPLISGTIAHITKSQQRNLAYAIYYWMINCGAFFVPLAFGLYFTSFPSAEAAAPYYRYIFFFSASFVIVNILITFFLYKNPKEPDKEKDIKSVFVNAAIVVKDIKFFSLLVIYSGFWFMFAMNHSYLPLYMLNFKLMPPWVTPLLLATINPGTIILVGPFLAKYMEKLPSLQMMILGSCIFMAGLLILGLWPSPLTLFIGVVIFSVGEFITHPNFISYVSKIAPKERVTIYMGYIFISTGIGLVLGSLSGGIIYENIARNMEQPRLFWAIVVSIGLISTFFLIFYNKRYSTHRPGMDDEIKETKDDRDIGIVPLKANFLESNMMMIAPLIVIPIILIIAQSSGTDTFHVLGEGDEIEVEPIFEIAVGTASFSSYVNENNQVDFEIEITEDNYRLLWMNASLTWQDEGSSYFGGTNEPDEFKISIINPNGDMVGDSNFETDGSLELNIQLDYEQENFKDEHVGIWMIVVEAGNCGDDSAFFPILGIRTTPDTGNDVSLEVQYTNYVVKE
jgi:MFS family permease